MDLRELRNCFGQFATGVTVITWNDDNGEKSGITVNSFTSVSLDPALVLVSIDKTAKACIELRDRPFIINILSDHQEEYAWQFAGRPDDNLIVEWEEDSIIGPRLKNTLATIECTPWKEYDGGDHVLFIGEVVDFSYKEEEALLFFRGKCLKMQSTETVVNTRKVGE